MIPNFLWKAPLPDTLPSGMRKVVLRLSECTSKEECLERAYEIVTARYHGDTIKSYTRFHELFSSDINSLWRKKGFLHSPNLNYILRVLLVESGHFTDDDIELKLSSFFGSPHQYMLIHIGKNRFMNIDPWSAAFGVKFGEYMHGWI